MREQVAHLLRAADLPKIEPRTMPFTAANRITVMSSLTLLQLAAQRLS